jgi:hypothetical protein
MKKILFILLAVVVIVAAAYYLYPRSRSIQTPVSQLPVPASTTTPIQPTQSTTVSVFTSSSSAQVGNFTVVANCKMISADGQESVGEIDILKGSTTVQAITTRGIAPGSQSCPKPESQDINFDGYPDFMIDADYGSGGTSVYYWLYNTSTEQFSCPEGSYVSCSLMNPSFDPASKTISASDELGASDSVFWIYKVNAGVISLYQETDITSSGTTTTKTIKQSANGQMVVVSTSTTPSSN